MKSINFTGIYSLAFLIIIITGCSGLSKSYPERSYFMFEVPPVAQKAAPVKGAIAEVSRFNVSPGSEGKEFIYRTGELSYESDFYNQFFRPPGAMLTEITIRWLRDTGLFQDVLSTVTQAGANYFIEANVVQLYGDYRTSPKAVMQIQFLLLKYSTDSSYDDNTGIVFAKSYTSEIPIASKTPNDLMTGWNTALGDILNAFLADLKNNVN
jgi:cholesterol transport system auxiliary component